MKLKKKFQNQFHIHLYDSLSFINRVRLGSMDVLFVECRICGKLRIR